MKLSLTTSCLAIAIGSTASFSIAPSLAVTRSHTSPLFSTISPPTDTEEVYGTIVGDTKGAVLRLSDVAISRGSSPLLKNIEWSVQEKERWGIVGINGAGKSTLLGAITGTVRMDKGHALVHANTRVGYLKQSAVSGSQRTVYEEAKSEMTQIEEANTKLQEVTKIVEEGDYSEEALNNLASAQENFQVLGGYEQEQMVDSVLKGLGFEPEDSNTLCKDFSGGWQMRIALARLLLSKPSLLLLDEPSNHLDSAAKDWLGKYLASFPGSLVLVSHDLSLLATSVNNLAEISSGSLLTYVSCDYDHYLTEKVFRAKSAQAEYERNVAEADRLQAYVD